MNRNNHEDNTNKARHNIYEYAQKNSEKYIKKSHAISGKWLLKKSIIGV